MSFMLALPKISLHGAGAIADMVNLVANKQWGKALIVTDGQLVKLGLLDSLFAALDEHQMSYHLFDEVFPNPTEELVQKGFTAYQGAECGEDPDRQPWPFYRLLRRGQSEKCGRAAGCHQYHSWYSSRDDQQRGHYRLCPQGQRGDHRPEHHPGYRRG